MFRTSLRPFYIMGSLIVALLIVTAGAGLLDPGMYRPFIKTDALFVGLLVQDAASLLAALLLAAAMYFAARGSVRALVTWCGLLAYVAYYYAFYCFGYTYTVFYPLYLALMGLAGCSLAGLLSAVDATVFARHAGPRLPVRLVAGVLGLTVLFIPLWLMQIAQGVRTQQVTETALVFVLDLSVLIPAALYAAVQIWRRRSQGYLVGGVMIFKAAASGILLTGGSIRQIVLGNPVGPDFGMYIFLAVVGSVTLALYVLNMQVAPTTPAPSPTQQIIPPPTRQPPAATRAPSPTPAATAAPLPSTSGPAWEVASLLVAPGEPGRLYALVKLGVGPLWGFPSRAVRLMISDDYAASWAPFPGGLPAPVDCMINLNLDYAAADGLYASTCSGLYAWQGNGWVKRSDRLVDVVSVVYRPSSSASTGNEELWAAERGKGVIHSLDGGQSWQDASAGLVTFGGLANLGIDPHNNATLYGIIRPKYAGSYLRRLTIGGQWQTMLTPDNNVTIETGMSIDGGSGALYVTTQIGPYRLWRSPDPAATDLGQVTWQLVHDFGAYARADVLASGWSPQGLALYANIWLLTPLGGGGASVGHAVLYRSPDVGQTWQALATP